ncbi:hypothetical protein DFH06DRAFT_177324 [Mycena polygramma]|nr:hypothetical protein DFH06DRAFT_177324 [Mycena polygramma]
MSTPITPRSSTKAPVSSDGDHRKRRRNRTTQSCLTCHAAKRMCDRKRPCSRCMRLGINASCVYEVDHPTRRQAGKEGEGARMVNRIAELEAVIRELKKTEGRQDSSPVIDMNTLFQLGVEAPTNNARWPSPASTNYSSAFGRNLQRIPGYSQPTDSLASLMAAYVCQTDHMFVQKASSCGCMTESACYNAVLELSLRLWTAVDVLARSPSHASHPDCALHDHISDLDIFAKNSLLDASGHSSSFPDPGCGFGPGQIVPPSFPTVLGQPYCENSSFVWPMAVSDNFMSWAPA